MTGLLMILTKMERPRCPVCKVGFLPIQSKGFAKECRRCQHKNSTSKADRRARVMERDGMTEEQYKRNHKACAICGADISDLDHHKYCRKHPQEELNLFNERGMEAVLAYRKRKEKQKELIDKFKDCDMRKLIERGEKGRALNIARLRDNRDQRLEVIRRAIAAKNGWFFTMTIWHETKGGLHECLRSFRNDLTYLTAHGELEQDGRLTGRRYRKAQGFKVVIDASK